MGAGDGGDGAAGLRRTGRESGCSPRRPGSRRARGKQKAALWSALGMPCALAAGIALSLWLAGWQFIPVMAEVAPPERWEVWTRVFAEAALWVHRNDVGLAMGVAAGVGRAGLAHAELVGAGPDLARRRGAVLALPNHRRGGLPDGGHRVPARRRRSQRADTFALLKGSSSALHAFAHRGDRARHEGRAWVFGALDGAFGSRLSRPVSGRGGRRAGTDQRAGKAKLSGFVSRWSARSEELLRRRAAALNAVAAHRGRGDDGRRDQGDVRNDVGGERRDGLREGGANDM